MRAPGDHARSLSTTKRIGLLGDTHGDLEHIILVSRTMWARGVSTLVVLGDSGFTWPGDSVLDELNRGLSARGQSVYWVCGNPECRTRLYEAPFGEDGLRWVRPHIAHIPTGYRTRLSSGRTLAAVNGASAGDVGNRTEGFSRAPQESITDPEPEVLGHEEVDVIIGNDPSHSPPTLDAYLPETDHYCPAAGRQDLPASSQKLTEGFMPVPPKLYLGRHYHQRKDDHFDYAAFGDPAEARIVLLVMNGSETISQAILDVRTLKLDFFRRSDTTVTELTGREEGCWRVTTWGSSHILDFNRWSATRIPGKGASATINDRERPLLDLRACRVGEAGYWTMDSDGWHDPMAHYWHQTSEIQSIERIADTVTNADRGA